MGFRPIDEIVKREKVLELQREIIEGLGKEYFFVLTMAYTVSSANQLVYLGSVWADPLELQNLCTSALGNTIVSRGTFKTKEDCIKDLEKTDYEQICKIALAITTALKDYKPEKVKEV